MQATGVKSRAECAKKVVLPRVHSISTQHPRLYLCPHSIQISFRQIAALSSAIRSAINLMLCSVRSPWTTGSFARHRWCRYARE
jgi:hypothetical protein